ncbi:hypothetical protein GCM10008107_26430 [Psychrosphaera saromensis]|uniref:Uncharacterized protein n=1 Tax=Psychrosphaera saromensis TaxID=716813 RepID=A0A2S7UXC4_9GAMM|nr:hypothetical protein [Psychrosphaera saromensis]PQJ54152.1 hypothetical protein BTO11_11165 [Psychrosphaera saromensis]GHB75536.1 hypothetical protein GCM10008107_26430 [Psychrosphaera saromensis]GLQ12755.1 hypothetical protein GCM10007917_02100 [Psychrosphaera saromensis]
MVRYLCSIFFICTLANASEQVCEDQQQAIDQQFKTIKDMIIILDKNDGAPTDDSYSVRFIKKPNKWDSISKWVYVPKSSNIIINSIALSKDKCKIPHHDEWLDCWIKTTNATYHNDSNEYKFKVSGVPEDKYLGCKSSNEFYNWVAS